MTTTTIRIDDDLKARVAAAAEQAGKIAHAFILDAIARTVEQDELDEAFPSRRRQALGEDTGDREDRTLGRCEDLDRGSIAWGATAQAGGSKAAALTGCVARVELAPEAFDDFDRFSGHMARFEMEDAVGRMGEIVQAIQLLTHSPLIGRPAKGGRRELIGRGSDSYVALYRFVARVDTVFVLAIRSRLQARALTM